MADNQYGPLQPKQTTASDIRKVVANGTKTTGKGFTIANKEELEQKEASKQNGLPKSVKIGGNVGAKVGANVGLNTGKTIQQTTPVKKEKPQGPVVQPTITPQQITGDLFKNPIVQPINNIKVLHKDGEAVNANGSKMKIQPNQYNYNSSKLIKTDTERKKDLSAGIEALYADAYNKVTDGQQLTLEEVLGNENYRKQFDGVDEGRIQELINDANTLAQYDDFDMQNLLSIYDKYKDFGLLLDVNKLSPKSKTAFISAIQGEGDNAIDKGIWQYMDIANVFSPLFWAEKAGEGFVNLTGLSKDKKTTKDLSQQIRERAANNKHDMLNEEEQNFAARDEIAKLDEKYKKYYTIDKDGKKKWNSMSKQNKYDEELMYIQNDVAKKHGDTLGAFWKNAFLNTIEVAATVHDMIANPGELIGGLGSTAVGTAENVASYGWDVYDWVKGNTMALHHKDVTQHLADLGGYDNYEEALQSAEYKLKDSPFKDLGMTILKQIQIDSSTAGLMGDYIAESYGSTDKFVESMGERPVETWSDIVSMLELGAFLSGKFGLISPMKSEALIDTLGNLDPFELGMKYGNKLNYGPVLKGETAALKLGGKTLKLPFKGVKNMGDMIVNKLSGLSEEERKFIRENPDDVDKFIKGEENSQSLIDRIVQKFDDLTSEKRKEGEEYENIRNSNVNVATKGLIDGIEEKLGTIGAKLTDKGIKLSKRFTPAIENKVNELYTYINDLRKKGNNATAEDLHWLRQQLDTVASWEKIPQGLEATFVNMVKDIRRLVDSSLKDQVPGMAEIDANYKTILADIKALRQDWFNKDGTLKDSAYSKIRNLTNKGTNQPKLERLETLIPGITQDLKALAVADTVEKASKQMVGQYAQQIRGVGGGITAISSLLTGGFSIPSVVLGLLGMQFATPKNLVSLLKFGGKIDKKINGVLDKIKNGTKLTALETAELARYLNENREDLREKAEYMHEKGLLSDEEYKAAMKNIDETEYARAQDKARNKAGDVENKMDEESKAKVLDFVKKRAKDVGFTTEVVKNMEKDTQGFTDLRNKLIALEKNPGDTTAQHELFHAFFSVVDDKTKAYLIQEARKILKENGMDVKNAEEWLAESFGIYAKRKMIDMGLIKAPKSFTNSLRNFFQKVYEYIQKFNGDRATINKVFDEVLGERKMKNGIMDLSDLLGGKKVEEKSINDIKMGDNGLRKKSVYHGSPADFDKFDSSHMGEGEGAQAHGWGHYVAVDRDTAKNYAGMRERQTGGVEFKIDGKPYKEVYKNLSDFEKDAFDSYKAYRLNDYSSSEAWDMVKEKKSESINNMIKQEESFIEYLNNMIKEKPEDIEKIKGMLKDTKEHLEIVKGRKADLSKIDGLRKRTGTDNNLYSLEIPDPVKADTPTGNNYLEEGDFADFKIRDKFIKSAEEYGLKKPVDTKQEFIDSKGGLKGAFEYEMNHKTVYNYGDMYDVLADYLGGQKQASKFLEKLGYDGIHYFGGRDGEAYVIFNDDALKIKEHIRYKKKIGDRDVEITPKVKSPDDLIEKNADGLSVMKSFISEKQAEKALNVNKALLDKDGNPYLWTHTNKYNAPQFANFENTKDSKYKEFTDKEIAWFTNNEIMSKSYANQNTKLANTKSPRTEAQFNKWLKSQEIVEKDGPNWENKYEFKVDQNPDGTYSIIKTTTTKRNNRSLRALAGWELGVADYTLEGMSKNDMINQIIERGKRNGYKIDISNIKEVDGNTYVDIKKSYDKSIGRYKDKKDMYAQTFSANQESNPYHYQGIITNVKKPLVVDLGKYSKGVKRYGKNVEGKGRYWSDLGTAYDFLKKNDSEGYKKITESVDKLKEQYKTREEATDKIRVDLSNVEQNLYDSKGLKPTFGLQGEEKTKMEKLWNDFNYGEERSLFSNAKRYIWNKARGIDVSAILTDDLRKYINNNPELKKLNKEAADVDLKFRAVNDLGRKSSLAWKEAFEQYLINEGVDKGAVSMLHGLPWIKDIRDIDVDRFLRDKSLQTNDYVFYALRKGDYDGVLFKDINDYGGEAPTREGGDVLAAFQSKDFKAWDNSNPTDSKYISYKKKVSLDKKQEGLQKKNSSGLLAKGRDRMGDNGIRYKKDIPEDKKLVGLHNLGIDKLRGVIELGGMPMPSIAVTKKGVPHESYGDITFIMKESAINPALSRKNKLYTVDGYTPTVPQPTIRVKDTKEANLLMDKIQKETGIGYGELMQWLEYHDDRYFEDYPKLKEFDKYYDQLTEKKLFDGFTYTGKRRYKDYNLDNIVKSMVGNKRDAFNGAFWKMVAQSQGNTTVEKLRDRKYGLKDKDLAEKMGEKYYDALRELASKKGIEQRIESLSDYGRFAENVSDAYRANTDAWWRELTQWDGAEGTIYSKITKEDLEPLQKIIKEAAELPRPYSEAKPERAIRFDEVGAVVAPEGKLKEVKDMLKDTGLKVYGYKDGERMSVVDRVADDNGLRFKKKVDQTQTPEFKKWFEGSKVVDKEGKPLVMYHGTNSDFNTFDKGLIKSQNWGKGFYFTSNKEDAKQYGKNTKAVYLDVKNPLDLTSGENEAEYNKWYGKKNSPYDGYVVNFSNGDKMVVVKSPNQIKSATDNIGTFDKNNPDIRYKKAYHGTAADFDKFDSSHMGEGEGAQAHGWGHYVAVNKGTAEKYANMLGSEKHNALAYKGEVRNPEKYQSLMVTRFDDEYQLNYGGSDIEGFKEDFPMIKERMLKGVERSRFSAVEDYNWELNDIAKRKKLGEKITPAQKEKLERLKEYVQGLDRTIKEIKDTKPEDITFKEQGGRHLYDLDIPDPVKADTPTGSNYLDEHGKLTEKQSEELITKAYNTYNEKKGLKPFDKITMEGVEKIGDEIVKDHQYDTTTFDYKKSFIDGVKEKVADGYSLPEAVNKELKWFTGMSSTIRKWKQAAGFFDALSDEVMEKFNRRNSGNGEGAYKYLTSLLGSDKAASKALESIGYDGIHYFGGRDGEAYVIFNDDSLEIKDHLRYKKGLQKKGNGLDKKSNASILAKGRDRK